MSHVAITSPSAASPSGRPAVVAAVTVTTMTVAAGSSPSSGTPAGSSALPRARTTRA